MVLIRTGILRVRVTWISLLMGLMALILPPVSTVEISAACLLVLLLSLRLSVLRLRRVRLLMGTRMILKLNYLRSYRVDRVMVGRLTDETTTCGWWTVGRLLVRVGPMLDGLLLTLVRLQIGRRLSVCTCVTVTFPTVRPLDLALLEAKTMLLGWVLRLVVNEVWVVLSVSVVAPLGRRMSVGPVHVLATNGTTVLTMPSAIGLAVVVLRHSLLGLLDVPGALVTVSLSLT